MLDLTDNILELIHKDEHSYKFNCKEINIGGVNYILDGTIVFEIDQKVTPETRDLPSSIESQYCYNIIDNLVLWYYEDEIDFVYTDIELMKVFEI